MCGITGFWDFTHKNTQDEQASLLRAMVKSLAHRGPNDSGLWQDEKVGLNFGHTRLSIIDLTKAGAQPMISKDGRYVLIYNGEIYNTQALRDTLILKGIQFKGHSDTETILYGLIEWGTEKLLSQLIGMFAFAFWDRKEKKLTLARDRLGIKPLYYGIHQANLFFGSELKSFAKHASWKPSLNNDALNAYFHYGFIGNDQSIYEGIHKLKPGHYIEIKNQNIGDEICYWNLREKAQDGLDNPLSNSFEENCALTEELIKDAVERRMVADVPLGCFLSGGIDSSLVAAMMQSSSSKPIKTFSIGFEDETYNEAPYAKKIAEHLGTDHTQQILKPQDILNLIPEIPTWFDEPFADSSALPTYCVSKLARQDVTVSLSGDGGDEFFAGYNRYIFAENYWQKSQKLPRFLRNILHHSIGILSPASWTQLSKIIHASKRHQAFGEKLYKFRRCLNADTISALYQESLCLSKTQDNFNLKGFDNHSIASLQYFDAKFYLPDDILTKVDRTSMAVGLEARVPLLDHRLVELSWQLPVYQKIQDSKGKRHLRHILEKHIPVSLFDRPKAGFSMPIAKWLRTDLREMSESLFTINSLPDEIAIRIPLLQEDWQNFLKGHDHLAHRFWSLLIFSLWKKQRLKQKKH